MVRQATQSRAIYTLCNRAAVPIQILDTASSCGCTGVVIPKPELAAGESMPLTLNFNSQTLRGPYTVRALVTYARRGESQPRFLPIALKTRVDPDYAVIPERLEFVSNRPAVQRVTITPRHVPQVMIQSVTCNLRFFTAELVETGDPKSRVIEVRFSPDQYYRDAGLATLVVVTDSKRQPVLKLPLELTEKDDVSSHLQRLSMGGTKP